MQAFNYLANWIQSRFKDSWTSSSESLPKAKQRILPSTNNLPSHLPSSFCLTTISIICSFLFSKGLSLTD